MINLTKSILSQVEAPTTVRSPAEQEKDRRRARGVYNQRNPAERELHPDRDEARLQELARALRTSLDEKPDGLRDAGWPTDEVGAAAAAESANGQAEKLGLDRQRADQHAGGRSAAPNGERADAAQGRFDNPDTGNLPRAVASTQSQLKEIFLAGERLLASGNAASIDEVLAKLHALRQTDLENLARQFEEEDGQRARLEGSFTFLEEFYGGLQTGNQDQVRLQSALALARAHVLGAVGDAGATPESADNAAHMPASASEIEDQQHALSLADGERAAADRAASADKENKRMAKLEQAQSDLSDYVRALAELAATIPTVAGAGAPALFEPLAQIRTFKPETSLARLRNARNGAVDGIRAEIACCLQKLQQACDALPTGAAGKEQLAKAITAEKRRLFKDDKELADAAAQAQLQVIRSREREIEARKADTLPLVTVRSI